MFSGIIETTSVVTRCEAGDDVLRIAIKKPEMFNDLNRGDSVSVDGVCLTLEEQASQEMTFCIGPETQRVTGWSVGSVMGREVNLERSLRFNERIHGHLVTGHVDAATQLVGREVEGETLRLTIVIPQALQPFIWPKGSVAVNGVSLTVNACANGNFSVGLIPETLARTNLKALKVGDRLNIEVDNMARGLINFARLQKEMDA